MKKIAIVGSINMDITCKTERFPHAGENIFGRDLQYVPGGKGNNQMTAANRAGVQAIIISRMGRDFLSSIMSAHYEREGMSTKYIKADDAETGSALIEVDTTTAQNRIIVIKGACDHVTAEDVLEAEADFADADAVITQLETSVESVMACKALAEK